LRIWLYRVLVILLGFAFFNLSCRFMRSYCRFSDLFRLFSFFRYWYDVLLLWGLNWALIALTVLAVFEVLEVLDA